MKYQTWTQSMSALLISVFFLVVIRKLAKKKRLSFRYALGWLALGLTGICAALIIPFTSQIAKVLNVTPAAVLGAGAIGLVIIICVQLSISISGLQEQTRILAEEVTILKTKPKEEIRNV
jgi:hypothetical protein